MPSVSQSVTSLSTQRYALRLVHVGFLLGKVAMLQNFPPNTLAFLWHNHPTMFHTH